MPQPTSRSCCFIDRDGTSLTARRENVVTPAARWCKTLPSGITTCRPKARFVGNPLGSWLKRVDRVNNPTGIKSPRRKTVHPEASPNQRTHDTWPEKQSPYHRFAQERARYRSANSRIRTKERALRPPRDVDKPLPALPTESHEGRETHANTHPPTQYAHASYELSHPKVHALQDRIPPCPTPSPTPPASQTPLPSTRTRPPLPPYTFPPCTRLMTSSLRNTARMLAPYEQLPLAQRIDPRVASQLRQQVRQFRGRSQHAQDRQGGSWTALPLLGWELKWLTYTMALFTESERDKARLSVSKDTDDLIALLKMRGVENACLTVWEACAMARRLVVDVNGKIVAFGELETGRDTDALRQDRALKFAGLRDIENKETGQRERIREAIERDMQRNIRRDMSKLEEKNEVLEHEIIILLTKSTDTENTYGEVKDKVLTNTVIARKEAGSVELSGNLKMNANGMERTDLCEGTDAQDTNTEHPGQDHVCDICVADVKGTPDQAPHMEIMVDELNRPDSASASVNTNLDPSSPYSRESEALEQTSRTSEPGSEEYDENDDSIDVETGHCSLTSDTGSSLEPDPLDFEIEQRRRALSVQDRTLGDSAVEPNGLEVDIIIGSGLFVERLEYEAAVQVSGMKERAAGVYWDIRHEKG